MSCVTEDSANVNTIFICDVISAQRHNYGLISSLAWAMAITAKD
jgi:hypothetical protein